MDGVGLAVTDAIALPDGRMLLSAAAEDSPNAVDDGPVVATALALVDGERVVEGLALRRVDGGGVHLLAIDDDDPSAPSSAVDLRVEI